MFPTVLQACRKSFLKCIPIICIRSIIICKDLKTKIKNYLSSDSSLFWFTITFYYVVCGRDVWNRSKKAIEDIINNGLENVAVVAHGGMIRVLISGF
ncbi:MAG: histidine phosphatase family protein [Clostridium sp.]|uniref:histidine phosphatase family protein n=1 Tax=Clostridium sp. TaxID=1506 RepID=UPI003D6CBF52